MIRARWVALVCLAGACGACSAAGDGPVYSDTAAPVLAVDAPLAAAEPEPCGVAFDPASELLEATQRAAERWSAATGCDVRVETGGIPLVAWPRLYVDLAPDGTVAPRLDSPGPESKQICGMINRSEPSGAPLSIDVALDSACDLEYTVAHESGHAFDNVSHHSDSGLMAAGTSPARSEAIDSASLATVCAGFPCSRFAPESEPAAAPERARHRCTSIGELQTLERGEWVTLEVCDTPDSCSPGPDVGCD